MRVPTTEEYVQFEIQTTVLKEDASHLDGDTVHQWDRYLSQALQDVGRKRHFYAGFSIVTS